MDRDSWLRIWLPFFAAYVVLCYAVKFESAAVLDADEPVLDWFVDGNNRFWEVINWSNSLPFLLIAASALFALSLALGVHMTAIIGIGIVTSYLFGIISAVVIDRSSAGLPNGGEFNYPDLTFQMLITLAGMTALIVWKLSTEIPWRVAAECVAVLALVSALARLANGDAWPSSLIAGAFLALLVLVPVAAFIERASVDQRFLRRSSASSA